MTTTSTTTAAVPGFQAGTWDIDASHSEVGFSVRHMMVSKVRGRFSDFAGTITTGADITDSRVDVTIQLASISTGNEQRDGHLRSPDFFETDAHPEMTYRATGVRADRGGFVLDGELSLKGVTKSVPVLFEIEGIGPDAFGGTRLGVSGTATIDRQEFNVTWNQAIEGAGVVVGDKVTIHLDIEAVLKA